MHPIRLVLFTIIAMLIPSVALAAQTDSEVVSGLFASWGNWPVFVGFAVAAAVRIWLVFAPSALERIPSRWRPMISIAPAGLVALGSALIGGSAWIVAAEAAVQAWVSALGTSEVLRMVFGKGTVAAAPASAVKAGTVSVVLLALLSVGCTASLENARSESMYAAPGVTQIQRDEEFCDKLDNRYMTAGSVEKVALSLSGAQGIGSVAIAAASEEKERAIAMGLGFGTVGGIGIAAGAGFVREHAATRWTEECSE